jgi:hypothetical protein
MQYILWQEGSGEIFNIKTGQILAQTLGGKLALPWSIMANKEVRS